MPKKAGKSGGKKAAAPSMSDVKAGKKGGKVAGKKGC
jgi:hypothetical protein